ncbi:MAG: UPF0758 domain-containing protein [Bacteroidota bacterium]
MQFWAEDDIPIEKLLLQGTANLSDAELLSILIGSGTPGENASILLRKSWLPVRTTFANTKMLLLNRANQIMKTVKVSEGGISGTVVAHDAYYSFADEGSL